MKELVKDIAADPCAGPGVSRRSQQSRRKAEACRILVVDDHPLTRRGMAQLIGMQKDMLICGEAGDAKQALVALKTLKPDLVLVDVTLPDKHGLELIKDIAALYPGLLVLVVSMHDESLYAERALRAGARGYLMKNEGGEKLLKAIRQVVAGEIYVSQNLSARILDLFSGSSKRSTGSTVAWLTDREFEVFQLIGEGCTTREVARHLHVSHKTVESHRMHIRQKLGFATGPELIKYAVRWAGAQDLI